MKIAAVPRTPDYAALAALAGSLASDGEFSTAARAELDKAAIVFRAAASDAAGESRAAGNAENSGAGPEARRALNALRHILLAETGRSPSDWDFIDYGGNLDPARRRVFSGMRVYLEDIRSPYNVGAMFRAAESFGAEKIYLSPLCADPLHPRAERTAMGCVRAVPWERSALQALSGPFFALETGGTALRDFVFPKNGIMIAGSEELGVSPEALDLAASSLGRVSIPAYGAKGSLNVSAAFAIAMQAWAETLADE